MDLSTIMILVSSWNDRRVHYESQVIICPRIESSLWERCGLVTIAAATILVSTQRGMCQVMLSCTGNTSTLVGIHIVNDYQNSLTVTWGVDVVAFADGAILRSAWCPLVRHDLQRSSDTPCTLTIPKDKGTFVYSNDLHATMRSANAQCATPFGCFLRVRATATGGTSQTHTSHTELFPDGLRAAPLSPSANVHATVHANGSITLEADAVVPYAFLRLNRSMIAHAGSGFSHSHSHLRARVPASRQVGSNDGQTHNGVGAGRFSDNALFLLPHEPVTIDYVPVAHAQGSSASPLPVATMVNALALDCPNRVDGCLTAVHVAEV